MTSNRDYSKGKIYKIEPICEHDEGEVYIGSTVERLCKRMGIHRKKYTIIKMEKDSKVIGIKIKKCMMICLYYIVI